MATIFAEDQAHRLIDSMPENATWDDLIHEIYVRQVIEQGLADGEAVASPDSALIADGVDERFERQVALVLGVLRVLGGRSLHG